MQTLTHVQASTSVTTSSAEPIQLENNERGINASQVETTPQSFRPKDWTFINHASRVTIGNETDLDNLVSLLEQTVLQTLTRYAAIIC
jgi:hypothetical protein